MIIPALDEVGAALEEENRVLPAAPFVRGEPAKAAFEVLRASSSPAAAGARQKRGKLCLRP